MRIIISPAKQMKQEDDVVDAAGMPVFMEQAKEVAAYMKALSYEEAKRLWACSDKLAEENYERLSHLCLEQGVTPAVLAYDGIAFKYMAPSVFANNEFDYVQDHLRILSALYGAVRPLDGVVPYRLEMQAKASVAGTKNLYDYWGSRLYDEVQDQSRVIINLASKEYSKCIEAYLQPEDTFVTCVFGELAGARVVQKGVYAKMARGDMVRFMAENDIEDPAGLKEYSRLGYSFDPSRSTATTYTFLK